MRQLEYEMAKECRRHREGSHATQADRLRIAQMIGRDLHAAGWKAFTDQKGSWRHLQEKHIRSLVDLWTARGVEPRTIANRLAVARTVFRWAGRGHLLPERNVDLGVPKTSRDPTEDRSLKAGGFDRERIDDRFVQASAWLMETHGLRAEESMKIVPSKAAREGVLHLEKTKGNRPRDVLSATPEQKAAVAFALKVAGKGSLIPASMNYKDHRDQTFYPALARAGLDSPHALRHRYAQDRYRELSGMEPPIKGGKRWREMDAEDLKRGVDAALKVSRELGHGRIEDGEKGGRLEVTERYLGDFGPPAGG